jgi:hypothetical protein
MAMGGAVCGGFLGIPLGAALGLILGLVWGHVSWGLDGAVLGILVLSGAGAVTGAFLGLTADERSLSRTNDGLLLPPADSHSLPSRRGVFHRRG